MPGGDDFILTTYEGRLEIRSIADGSLKREFNNPTEGIVVHNLEITPDSSRILLTVGGYGEHDAGFELRSLEDFSLINKYELPLEGEVKNEENLYYRNRIEATKINPVKPHIYFILKKDINGGQFNKNYDYYAIKVYNYETMQEVKELRTYKKDYMKVIDVSHDGKHLASLNSGEGYINIWDLNSFELVANQKLHNKTLNDNWWIEADDLEFDLSENSKVYFTGIFQDYKDPNQRQAGVYEYQINSESYKNLTPETRSDGKLIFIEKQSILFLNSVLTYYYFDFNQKSLELKTLPNKNNSLSTTSIYSSKHKLLIGASAQEVFEKDIRAIRYQTLTNIEDLDSDESIIYPNPATNSVTIEISCTLPEVRLELLDIQGSLLLEEIRTVIENSISFNLSAFPSGSYLIRINCDSHNNTYKIIKEG
jgi:hypothetical protein